MNSEPQLNPLDFCNSRSIDAARAVLRLIEMKGIQGVSQAEIVRIIDNHTDYLPEAGQKWVTAAKVDEQGEWWWWNGDQDSAPVAVSVLYSGFGDNYFASVGQLGWTRAQDVTEMGGLWRQIIQPNPPYEI